MNYFDLGFISEKSDNMFFLNLILGYLHDNSYKWNVAISFPNFSEGTLVNTNKSEYNSYAKIGNILRVFHLKKEILDELLNDKLIQDFKKKNIIINTKVLLAPNSSIFEFYIRDQTENHIRIAKKKLKTKDFTLESINGNTNIKDATYCKKRIDDLTQKNKTEQINKFYLLTYSKSKNTNFSLFIKREKSVINTNNFNPSSYCLSNKENPTYLPLFESSLDL